MIEYVETTNQELLYVFYFFALFWRYMHNTYAQVHRESWSSSARMDGAAEGQFYADYCITKGL
ncbi:hypothetical protein KSZ_23500 [Dictyobacter formicarum]|uniref:Uncharacterized protein n=1 Tax=Dictyobacter formicarum TaxID=2778368 RepID=A0ABQ3VE07_9CHLR|nr:hypothetical protein KSZ_23500 [Dictyobacter formicarum]